MPTALIAEDEPMLRAQLKARLSEAWPELGDIVEAENGDLALALIDERRPDVAFLDIRMPRQSGLDVARAIAGRCHVVFVTAYDEYAIAAFDEGAIDYVLKPVTADRIGKVVARIKARLATPPLDLAALLAKLAAREESAAPLRWIRASLGNVMQMIAVVDVVYFQAEDKYTKVVTRDSAALIRKPIKDLYDELDQEAFWQIHRA
ncbi:MAG TPA: LytTR family DNA-binding domain-containing protein, partial [Casimicrobiaceae bacterium]|nr:LytTR family DNA-binding domain-containing protein [Casimicrobiaceae bacterium]